MSKSSDADIKLTIWSKDKVDAKGRSRICWRIKDQTHVGRNHRGVKESGGRTRTMSKKEALCYRRPVILEILFEHNSLDVLVEALKEAGDDAVQAFLADVRYLLICNSDARMADISYMLSKMTVLSGFSYRNERGVSDETFKELFPALANAQVRAVDINGSCPKGEVELLMKSLNVELIRFHRYPGVDVSLFESTSLINSSVEFVVAQGIRPGQKDGGMKFLSSITRIFPGIKSLYWDWNMMPTLNDMNDEVIACIEYLVNIYKQNKLNLLAVLMSMPCKESLQAVPKAGDYLLSFNLPNSMFLEVVAKDKKKSGDVTNSMFFIAGTSEKMRRLEETICEMGVTEPDLRHFLYVLDRNLDIRDQEHTHEFLGFDV
ncbi:unnamed protein product [Thelazia callipaeda]|uniref:F-box/LRR-repeat protein n=1 Tax=Thelazia callipaeda TaxID=103827 RepID=A0A0N5D6R4_THECL|nr:unnamed protein product [Thelazia callipaeda]